MVAGGSRKIYAVDDEEHGRRHRPRAEGARAREARTRHAGDLHQRQRRRTLLLQLAVFVPEDGPVRRRHARAGDRPLARRDSRRGASPSRRRSPWTGPRRFSPSPERRPIASYPLDGENLLPVCTGARPSYDRTLFWRTVDACGGARRRWKYLADEDGEYLFDLAVDPGEKDDRRRVEAARFERLKQQYLDWNARMLPRPATSSLQ